MLLKLLCRIIMQPCLNELRCIQRLGYFVATNIVEMHRTQGLAIRVVHDRFSMDCVEKEIESVMKSMGHYIYSMKEKTFREYKETTLYSYIPHLKTSTQAYFEENESWKEIVTQRYNFHKQQPEIYHLNKITRKRLLQFYEDLLSVKTRRKLVVHVKSAGEASRDGRETEGRIHTQICGNTDRYNSILSFRNSQSLCPLLQSNPYRSERYLSCALL